jgi:Uma2 family endonuclease
MRPTGASRKHNLVSGKIYRELSLQLESRPCEAYINAMRVKSKEANSYHYPDLAIVCGAPEFEDTEFDTLLNPAVLNQPKHMNGGGKFALYRKIASLREYLLVAPDQPLIERYARAMSGC